MSGQSFRLNGLDDHEENHHHRSSSMQNANSCTNSSPWSWSSSSNRSTVQNSDSFAAMDYGGCPPCAAVSNQHAAQSSKRHGILMKNSIARSDNVARPMQNVSQCMSNNGNCVQPGNDEFSNLPSQFMGNSSECYGSRPQQMNFNVKSYGGIGSGKPFMGSSSTKNNGITESWPNMRIKDYSANEDGQLYTYDEKTRKLRPLEPEEMQQLIIPNDDAGQYCRLNNVAKSDHSKIDDWDDDWNCESKPQITTKQTEQDWDDEDNNGW